MFAFAKPYRRQIFRFLLLVIVDAVLIVATPLLFKRIIDDGVLQGDRAVVTRLALIIAGLAVAEAGLTLAQRWYSARIGEGLIFDLQDAWCSDTCSGCRWRSSPAPTPDRWCRGSTTT